jgi:hypothetical protein
MAVAVGVFATLTRVSGRLGTSDSHRFGYGKLLMNWKLYTEFQELIDPRHKSEDLEFNIFSKTNLTGFLDYAMGLDDGLNEHVIPTGSVIRLLRRFVRKVRAIAELEKEGRLKLIAFDLARPLPDQLKEAKSTLAKAQREKVNNMKQGCVTCE